LVGITNRIKRPVDNRVMWQDTITVSAESNCHLKAITR
jgi:hypothetical protein